MITIPKKKCNKVNCNELINFNESYCDEHKQLKNESRKQFDKQRYEHDKEVRQTYNSTTWKHSREGILLRDNHLCRYCLHQGRYEVATLVDHFIPVRDAYEDRYNQDNLVSACDKCNTRKTTDEELLRSNKITIEEYKNRWLY